MPDLKIKPTEVIEFTIQPQSRSSLSDADTFDFAFAEDSAMREVVVVGSKVKDVVRNTADTTSADITGDHTATGTTLSTNETAEGDDPIDPVLDFADADAPAPVTESTAQAPGWDISSSGGTLQPADDDPIDVVWDFTGARGTLIETGDSAQTTLVTETAEDPLTLGWGASSYQYSYGTDHTTYAREPQAREGGDTQEFEYEPPVLDDPWTHHGTNGSDLMVGTDAHETFYGDSGDDIIDARGGDDYIDGGMGNDIMIGGDGNDQLWGGALTDVMTGGADADTFGFYRDYGFINGVDVITDFEVGVDTLAFAHGFLDVTAGEALHDNLIALDGPGGVHLWADTTLDGLAHIATMEGVTAAEIQPLIDSEMILL